jgi:CRISPR/Cas system CSM-associated protein Csm2 small subunit
MDKSIIIDRINELRRDAGITHDQLAEIVYEARDNRLREIREQYQENCIMFYFKDGIVIHQIKGRTVPEFVEMFPDTLRELITDIERKDGELGMMVNSNIPNRFATFQMSL